MLWKHTLRLEGHAFSWKKKNICYAMIFILMYRLNLLPRYLKILLPRLLTDWKKCWEIILSLGHRKLYSNINWTEESVMPRNVCPVCGRITQDGDTLHMILTNRLVCGVVHNVIYALATTVGIVFLDWKDPRTAKCPRKLLLRSNCTKMAIITKCG